MKTGFGWIEICGKQYDYDIIIHVDGTISKRHKKISKPLKETYGHTPLSGNELEFLQNESPETVYIGTGQYGDLPITPDGLLLLDWFDSIVKPTPVVLELIQQEKRRFAAVMHVTC